MIFYTYRSFSHTCQDNPTDPVLQAFHHLSLQYTLFALNALPLSPFPPLLRPQHILERARNHIFILFEIVNHAIRSRVERIPRHNLPRLLVHTLHPFDRRPTHIVEVEDGGIGVQARGVEAVTLPHGDLGETLKILFRDGFLHRLHRLGNDLRGARLEQGGGLDGGLHARGAADALLLGGDDEDESTHLGPVGAGSDKAGEAVAAVEEETLVPCYVAPEERAACGAGALAGNEGELGGGLGELVKIRDGTDQGCKARGGGGKASGCGEVVGGAEAERVGREGRKGGVGFLEVSTEGTEGGKACLGSGVGKGLGFGVQEERVRSGVRGGAGGSGVGAEIGLREGNREGGVGREIETGVTLAPISVSLNTLVN